jgi:hypothetical protein
LITVASLVTAYILVEGALAVRELGHLIAELP